MKWYIPTHFPWNSVWPKQHESVLKKQRYYVYHWYKVKTVTFMINEDSEYWNINEKTLSESIYICIYYQKKKTCTKCKHVDASLTYINQIQPEKQPSVTDICCVMGSLYIWHRYLCARLCKAIYKRILMCYTK